MEIKQLNELLLGNIERIVNTMLPGAKKQGTNWICADRYGGVGSSMVIDSKTGKWKDFASGEKQSDLVDLFTARSGSLAQGIKEAKSFLGIKDERKRHEKATSFAKPKRDWVPLREIPEVLNYFLRRGITEEVCNDFGVMAFNNRYFSADMPNGGPGYCFVTRAIIRSGAVVDVMAKYTMLERDDRGKKIEIRQPKGLDFLFGACAEMNKGATEIVITSGQIDALSYAVAGIQAVSIPSGDNVMTWLEHSFEYLSAMRVIYISFDNDTSAEEAAKTVIQRLGMSRCKVINIPHNFNGKEIKDANDFHMAGGDLRDLFNRAEFLRPPSMRSGGELTERLLRELSQEGHDTRGSALMGWDTKEESVGFRIRPGELTIWTGFEGSGKSTILYQSMLHLMTVERKKAFIISLEEPNESILSYMIQQLLGYPVGRAEMEEVFKDEDGEWAGKSMAQVVRELYEELIAPKLTMLDMLGACKIAQIVDTARYAVQRHGAEHVVIDSLLRVSDLDIEDNAMTNKIMEEILGIANETGAHVHLVAHSRKPKGPASDLSSIPGSSDIKGSACIPGVAWNIISMWRNTVKSDMLTNPRQQKYDKEDVAKWADAQLRVCKQRATGKLGTYPVWFDPMGRSFHRIQSMTESGYKRMKRAERERTQSLYYDDENDY
jgi:twinkle protein